MTRATRAVINLAALQHNLEVARRAAPYSLVMAIIKANAYGHGLSQVARALSKADAFGVATLDEALQLRAAGIHQPITLLEGFTRAEQLAKLRLHQFDVVLHHEQQLEILEAHPGVPVGVWFKIDTGMHRLGFAPQRVNTIYQRLLACGAVKKPIAFFTHLANADVREDTRTTVQLQLFHQTIDALQLSPAPVTCAANSAGILGCKASHSAWVRPGIMLFGVSPFVDSRAAEHELQPVMTLHSELIAVNQHPKGAAIGYGGTYVCPETMPVGVIAIGYGDGYPRHAKSGTPVLVNGQPVPLIGRVSMDMISVDLRSLPQARIGDPVILWGEGLSVEEIAQHADTIGYQLLCGVTTRVPYEYQN
ncbi:MAG: alanine racemase [Gammaproteobacteria bacterium]|nr:alanine racemase [Gammaproteobacteria bacterium]